jgi:response regulator RpfG family c-di-GMP phosphodiesterase
MLPYILLGDNNLNDNVSFEQELEKQVAYAAVKTVEDGQTLLNFLSARSWKELPSMILINYDLPGMKASDILCTLLEDPRYADIPKLIWGPSGDCEEVTKCKDLGASLYLKKPDAVFELEAVVRQIDSILKTELSIV